jgi:hypothetical protein
MSEGESVEFLLAALARMEAADAVHANKEER